MDIIPQLIRSLRDNPAFGGLPSMDIKRILVAGRITHHEDGDRIMVSNQNLDTLYVVQEGRVALKEQNILLVKMIQGDVFPLGIMESGSTSFLSDCDAISEGKTTIVHIPLLDIQKMRERNGLLGDEKKSSAPVAEPPKPKRGAPDYIPRQGESSVTLGHLMSLRKPYILETTKTILDAAKFLAREPAIALVEGDKAYAMITASDICKWINTGTDLKTPLFNVVNKSNKFLKTEQHKSDAEKRLLSWRLEQAIVVDGHRVAGIVSMRDLMDRRSAAGTISRRIEAAPDLDELVRCAEAIRDLAASYIAEGIDPLRLTRFVAGMNDELTQRILILELAKRDMHFNAYSWIALGSEGRMEQTLHTDQDNALIIDYDSAIPPDVARDEMLDLARSVNQALADCGIELCRGNIMASNPLYCLTLDEWKEQFRQWISNPTPDSLVNATIFFDFRHIHGNPALARSLSEWLATECRLHPRFLHLLTQMAIDRQPPLSFMKNFTTDSDGLLDLKLFGVTLFVDAARIFSLASGIDARNTVDRLRQAAEKKVIREGEAEAWIDAFNEVQTIRLQYQLMSRNDGETPGNRINPKNLSTLLSKRLLEALKTAKIMQHNLSLKYIGR